MKDFKYLLLLVITLLFISGCNAFESFDHATRSSDEEAIEIKASIVLASGDFGKAHELYDRLISEGVSSDTVFRGRAQAAAGLAGFDMLNILNQIQNSSLSGDTSAVFFSASQIIDNAELIESALKDINKLNLLEKEDYLLSSLFAVIHACKRLNNKYDTNRNKRFDLPDQIFFDTRDKETEKWNEIYANLVENDSIYSLEKAFFNMAAALEGRGNEWVFLSPVEQKTVKGDYTVANAKTVSAVSHFVEVLNIANSHYEIDEERFKQAIMLLDGN